MTYPPTTSPSVDGWVGFLNYYFWLQYCVDLLIHQARTTVDAAFPENTWLIFTADHGDYGGSHWLHAKGGALYDEVINTPLYISDSTQRSNPDTVRLIRNFVCSSVDVLPFVYSMALGNESWRRYSCDIISYLGGVYYPGQGRESIRDAIMSGDTAKQRRVAYDASTGVGIACISSNPNGQNWQPYIIHTTDEFSSGVVGSPSHAIAFRTVDITQTLSGSSYVQPYGGGSSGSTTTGTRTAHAALPAPPPSPRRPPQAATHSTSFTRIRTMPARRATKA